ncbi:hypothetical protein ACOMHN_027089 [Nucella lapillus]
MRLHHDKRPCCVMGHAEDGSIEFAALALTEESTDKLSEERQSWSGNAKTEATALAEAFLERNPTFPEETTSMDVSVEEELMNATCQHEQSQFCSCFYRSIRTNNDVEGWHRRLNSKASSRLQEILTCI